MLRPSKLTVTLSQFENLFETFSFSFDLFLLCLFFALFYILVLTFFSLFSFQMFTMRVLRLLCLVLAVINSSLAQCPWHKDVPDLQTACLCAYNLGHELSVQCDQVRDAPIIHRTNLNSFD